MEIVLNREMAVVYRMRVEFVEREPDRSFDVEPGLEEFLRDPLLSGDTTEAEIEFLRSLRFYGKQPLPLYYYWAVQNLRDPLHFRAATPGAHRSEPGLPWCASGADARGGCAWCLVPGCGAAGPEIVPRVRL